MLLTRFMRKEKNNRMMVGILSQIVEFRNGESDSCITHSDFDEITFGASCPKDGAVRTVMV